MRLLLFWQPVAQRLRPNGSDCRDQPRYTRRIFRPHFQKVPGLEQQLIEEFIYCKEHNATTDTFGSDAVFTFPPYAVDAQLARIHIKLPDEQPRHLALQIGRRRVILI